MEKKLSFEVNLKEGNCCNSGSNGKDILANEGRTLLNKKRPPKKSDFVILNEAKNLSWELKS